MYTIDDCIFIFWWRNSNYFSGERRHLVDRRAKDWNCRSFDTTWNYYDANFLFNKKTKKKKNVLNINIYFLVNGPILSIVSKKI